MDVQGKRLLILGAGRGQIGLYKAAREMGVTTIAGTMAGNNLPCVSLADEICYMNILSPDEVEKKTIGLQFDGVATSCLDLGLKALGRLCDRYDLSGYSEQAAELCSDKLKMKYRLCEYGVNTATYFPISTENELFSAVNEIGSFPLIIKATDLAGSQGIFKVENAKEALDGFRNAMNVTRKDYVLIEQFIQGHEFGVQAFVFHGEVLFVMPHGDILYQAATAVPVGHYVPYSCSKELQRKIELEAKKAIKAIGLDNCAVNIDFIEKNGNVYVLELTGRVGANCLPELVSIYYGVNYYEMIVATALGLDPKMIWDKRREGKVGLSRMFISSDKSGILESLQYLGEFTPDIYDLTLFARKGSLVRKFSDSSDCLAQVVVEGYDLNKCERRIEEVMSQIELILR